MKTDWTQIAATHGAMVWQTIYRILGHDADAADCFQETFIAALSVTRRETVANWGGLLRRLATLRAIDALRRRRQEPIPNPLDESIAGRIGPVEEAQARELSVRLREALRDLPATQAEVFCLRHLSEMSYEEIAGQIGTSVDVVGVTLHRARAGLRDKLQQPTQTKRRSQTAGEVSNG